MRVSQKRRQNIVYAVALFGATWCISCLQLFHVDTNSFIDTIHRQLLGKSCKTPYVTGHDVFFNMPEVVPPEKRSKPSHVQLCQAYLDLKQVANEAAQQDEDEESTVPAITTLTPKSVVIEEDPELCSDWASPHSSIMEIFASSLIAKIGAPLGLKYVHNCYKQLPRVYSSKSNKFDYTPAQVILPNHALISSSSAAKVDEDLLSDLCSGCIQQFESGEHYTTEDGSVDDTHHCLLFPGDDSAESIVEKSTSHLLPLAAILPSMVDRLRHLAWDWLHTTDPIDLEDKSGVVVFIDDQSTFLNYNSYDHIIQSSTPSLTSIQIFLSANCALAQIKEQSDCVEHGRRLKRHFVQHFTLTKGVYVRLDIVASTAAAYARMIHSKLLICPPGTVGCLIPALAKNPNTEVYIAEHPDRPSTRHWYDHLLAEHKKTRVVDATSPNEMLKEEVRMNAVDLEILDNVDTTMPLSVIGEGEGMADNKNRMSEKEEEEILHKMVNMGEFEFEEKLIKTPLKHFGSSQQEEVLSEIPNPIVLG